MFPELEQREVIAGAFDARSLGTGGAHVLPVRRPGMATSPRQEDKAEEEHQRRSQIRGASATTSSPRALPPPAPPPMKFKARCGVGSESAADRYNRSILDDQPQT